MPNQEGVHAYPGQAKQALHNKTSKREIINVKVYSPFKVFFDGEALSISAENGTGPFDVLPEHHNFLTLLRPCELVIRTLQQEQKIHIESGVMHVKKNKVSVFLNI